MARRSRTRSRSRERRRESRRRSRSPSEPKNQNQGASYKNQGSNYNNEREHGKPFEGVHAQLSELFVKRQVTRISIMETGTQRIWARSPSPIPDDSDDEEYLAKQAQLQAEREEAMRKMAAEAIAISSGDEKMKLQKHKKSKKSKKKKKKDRKERKGVKAEREDVEEEGGQDQEDQWVENIFTPPPAIIDDIQPKSDPKASIGPEMPEALQSLYDMDFGKGLMPGEGVAMAEFVANGQRIPRRGEIGMTNDDIQAFERAGYIMSGNRHRRMEAVRLRKESQIYSAEEKRALQLYSKQERDTKETGVIQQFRDMVKHKTLETQRKNE